MVWRFVVRGRRAVPHLDHAQTRRGTDHWPVVVTYAKGGPINLLLTCR